MGSIYKNLRTVELAVSSDGSYIEGRIEGSKPADSALAALVWTPGLVFTQVGLSSSTPPGDVRYGLSGSLILNDEKLAIAGLVMVNGKYSGKTIDHTYDRGDYCLFRIPKKGDVVVLRNSTGTIYFGDFVHSSGTDADRGFVSKAYNSKSRRSCSYVALENATSPGETIACEVL